MSKLVLAKWEPETKTLKLFDPLEGVSDSSEVNLDLAKAPIGANVKHWSEFAGSLNGEAGDELAAIVEEMFPTEK